MELEKELAFRYGSGTTLIDKRNIINELIAQLENEKVPEVKYQIYLCMICEIAIRSRAYVADKESAELVE